MEKLEQIMRAEESTRRALTEAREHARSIRKEAAAEAELIVASGMREAEGEAVEVRASILREADAHAAEQEQAAETRLADVVQQAEAAFDDAVDALVHHVSG